jgi:hypothetical protein
VIVVPERPKRTQKRPDYYAEETSKNAAEARTRRSKAVQARFDRVYVTALMLQDNPDASTRFIAGYLTACDEDAQRIKHDSPSIADGVFCSVGGINVYMKDAESAMTGLFSEAYMDAYGMVISKCHWLSKYPVNYLSMAMGRQIMEGGDQTEVLEYAKRVIAKTRNLSILSVLLIEGRHILINVDLSRDGIDFYLYDCVDNVYKENIMESYKKFFNPFRCKNNHTWLSWYFDGASPSKSVTNASESSPFVCAAMDIIAHDPVVEHFNGILTNPMMLKVRIFICAFLRGLVYP